MSFGAAKRIGLGLVTETDHPVLTTLWGPLGWPLEKDGQPSKSLIQAKSYGIAIISERRFLEWIGKSMPEEQAKAYSTAELAALSKLQADVIERLSTFGLVEAREGLYGFRDLAGARQVAQLHCRQRFAPAFVSQTRSVAGLF